MKKEGKRKEGWKGNEKDKNGRESGNEEKEEKKKHIRKTYLVYLYA